MYRLRPARRADAKAIRAMVLQERLNPFGIHWQRFIIAESAQGQVIGCGQVKTHADGSRELASLVVAPAWRLRGVGRAIIQHLVQIHPAPLYLICRASLAQFYLRFGFRAIAESDMPPYFKLVSRLYRGLRWLHRNREALLVMKHSM